MGSQPYRT